MYLPCISRFRPAILASLIILAFLLGFPGQGEAKGLPIFVNEEVPPKVALPLYVPDEIVAKFKPEIADDTIEAFLKTKGLLEKYKSKLGEFRVLRIPTGKSVPELVEIFRASPLVEYAEPNYYAYAAWTPNDPYYQYQWHLDNAEYGGIEIEEAWDIETGYSRVIVAVIDTGIAYEDLPGPGFWHLDTYNAYGESGHSWWCGVSEALSSWTALYGTDPAPPGYGNGWKQYLQHSFNLTAATGTVTFSYQIRYHTELNYDYVYVEVSSDGGGSWDELKSYTGPRLPKFVKWTADSVDLTDYKGSNILLRFRFNSDEVYSDEDGDFDSDGAVYIDEVKLEDGSGVIFYDDAESGAGAWEVTQYQKAPDLAGTSFWVNPGEIAGDGIDNDNNGYVDDVNGWDFVNSDSHPNDDNSHGTHVSGTIAQSTDNNLGVAGVAFNTTVMPLKVLSASGAGTYQMVADGIYYAANNGARIINLSLGGGTASAILEEAVAYAYSKGVTILAAAGNSDSATLDYPAAYDDYCIAVGATQYDETKAPYSNYGPSLDIVAPGGNTGVDQNGDGYADGVLQQTFGDTPVDWGYWFYQGTSMSTPHASGVAALLLARNRILTPAQIRNALESTAEDLGDPGKDDTFGWGLIDACAALQSVPALPPSKVTEREYTTIAGEVVTVDENLSATPQGITVALENMTADEGTFVAPIILTTDGATANNTVTNGHYVYKCEVAIVTLDPGAKYTVKLFKNGTQVANTIYIAQHSGTPAMGDRVTIRWDTGALIGSAVWELEVAPASA